MKTWLLGSTNSSCVCLPCIVFSGPKTFQPNTQSAVEVMGGKVTFHSKVNQFFAGCSILVVSTMGTCYRFATTPICRILSIGLCTTCIWCRVSLLDRIFASFGCTQVLDGTFEKPGAPSRSTCPSRDTRPFAMPLTAIPLHSPKTVRDSSSMPFPVEG